MPSPGSAFSRHARRLATAVVVAASAASALLGASLAAPASVAGMGPLPACRYDDILTAPAGYDDWSVTLVDTILRVTKAYVPPDLVPVSDAGIAGSARIRAVTIDDLQDMTAAAKKAGNPIAVQSAYRSYTTQESTFQGWVDKFGYQEALLYSARPGHSEHQLGLAIDFKSAGGSAPWSGSDWGQSPAGTWMRRHAWEYGWVQSYPKGKKSKTCYAYESWHFRYVGRALAAKIHASGLTPREYLWANFTTAIVPGASGSPASSAGPSPSAEPSPSAVPSPSPEPVPSASPVETLDEPTIAPTPVATAGPSPAGTTADPVPVAAAMVVGLGVLALFAVSLRRQRGATRSGPGSG